MPQPVLFVIDDDPGALNALQGDLRRRFGEDFCVIAESSAPAGLARLRELGDARVPVALLIAGHDLSGMPGVTFLAHAHQLHPLAKRVLLVERDYSARSPIVQAMTLGQADYHFTKPWLLEQDLYRAVSEFLADWAKDQDGGFELFQVIGQLQDPRTHDLRELLVRFNMPFRFHAAGSDQGGQLMQEKGLSEAELPAVIRHDGYTMPRPAPAEIMTAVGVSVSSDVSECGTS